MVDADKISLTRRHITQKNIHCETVCLIQAHVTRSFARLSKPTKRPSSEILPWTTRKSSTRAGEVNTYKCRLRRDLVAKDNSGQYAVCIIADEARLTHERDEASVGTDAEVHAAIHTLERLSRRL